MSNKPRETTENKSGAILAGKILLYKCTTILQIKKQLKESKQIITKATTLKIFKEKKSITSKGICASTINDLIILLMDKLIQIIVVANKIINVHLRQDENNFSEKLILNNCNLINKIIHENKIPLINKSPSDLKIIPLA